MNEYLFRSGNFRIFEDSSSLRAMTVEQFKQLKAQRFASGIKPSLLYKKEKVSRKQNEKKRYTSSSKKQQNIIAQIKEKSSQNAKQYREANQIRNPSISIQKIKQNQQEMTSNDNLDRRQNQLSRENQIQKFNRQRVKKISYIMRSIKAEDSVNQKRDQFYKRNYECSEKSLTLTRNITNLEGILSNRNINVINSINLRKGSFNNGKQEIINFSEIKLPPINGLKMQITSKKHRIKQIKKN